MDGFKIVSVYESADEIRLFLFNVFLYRLVLAFFLKRLFINRVVIDFKYP